MTYLYGFAGPSYPTVEWGGPQSTRRTEFFEEIGLNQPISLCLISISRTTPALRPKYSIAGERFEE
jgi:hypothetical protein